MSALKPGDLAALLARFPADVRLLLFAGPDESASHALARTALAALSEPADPMAITSLAAEQLKADPGLLADAAAAVSMFGGRQVIRVDGASDAVAEAVALLLAAPAAGNPVVMQAGELPKTSALRKAAEGSPAARLILSYAMDARAAQAWLHDRARTLGLVLAPGVAERLAQATAQDVGAMGQELEKFALFLGAAPGTTRRVEPEHLAALGAGAGEEDLFALLAGVIAGDGAEVTRQLGLLPSGTAIMVLRGLARKLMQLMELRMAIDGGANAEAAARAMRPPLFWREQQAMAAAAARWAQPRIARALASVQAAEAAIKAPASAGEVVALQGVAMMAASAGQARGLGGRGRRA